MDEMKRIPCVIMRGGTSKGIFIILIISPRINSSGTRL